MDLHDEDLEYDPRDYKEWDDIDDDTEIAPESTPARPCVWPWFIAVILLQSLSMLVTFSRDAETRRELLEQAKLIDQLQHKRIVEELGGRK